MLAMAAVAQPVAPPRADARLDFFVGEWTSRNVHHASPFGPAGTSTGTARYQWAMDGVWLQYESRFDVPGLGPYEVRGGVAVDLRVAGYRAFAYNSLGVVVEYVGDWESETRLVLTAVRSMPVPGTRVVYEQRSDGTVLFLAEREAEGGSWVAYFESELTRAPPAATSDPRVESDEN
jgi:hypothetical protein